ncbi:MAG: heterodisulfide reductase-related iron-sulfur binding cluster [Chloroflexi bacterium]|nr:heterodisulfide reductase-related iron-sulfur binding cluster [Chloroflexota bacterium]
MTAGAGRAPLTGHEHRAAPGTPAWAGADAPSLEDLRNCIHCGFCLPACPTYAATGQELESPRGRLHLIRAVVEGRAQPTAALLGHLDLCLQCRACETACPSGVPYGRIMEDARASVLAAPAEGSRPPRRPLAWRLRALVLREVVSRPRALRFLTSLVRLYGRSGLQRLVRGPLARALPARLRWREGQLPDRWPAPFRASGRLTRPAEPGGRAALLTGCIHGELFPETHEATVRVLARLGVELVAPAAQRCCGALHAHAGDAEQARSLARANIAAFEEAGVEEIVVNAAGCGAAMKEYGRLLRHDPAWAERAERFAGRVRDVLEFVAARPFAEAGLGRVERSVTLQEACHLAHGQRIHEAPRTILRAIPGMQLVEMATPDRCCGSAGIYSAVQPEMSARVLETKMGDIAGTGASVVATANPGCTLQLRAGIRRRGLEAEARHVIEILDEAYRAGAPRRP